jgi:hypothetical protein
MRIKQIILGISLVALAEANAFAPTNFFPPYDPALKLPPVGVKTPFRLGFNVEYGDTHNARDWNGDKHNVLQIYNKTESTIAMLEQPTTAVNTPDFQKFVKLIRTLGGASRPAGISGRGAWDDGERGHLELTGKFEQWDITPHGRYLFDIGSAGELGINLALPIRYAQLHNVNIQDLTGSSIVGTLPTVDTEVKEYLTTPIKHLAEEFGDLDLNNWDKTDFGDLALWLDWNKDFAQDKGALKNVAINAKLGLTFPTGLEKDENKAFSFAFGHDGAWAMPFGIGLDLDFKHHIALGAEAEFEVTFDHSKTRRMMTHPFQTEFLLLNKGDASKDHGLMWKFYLYLQGYRFWKGLSLKAAYEYVKHDSDSLSPKSNEFNSSYVNMAHSLNEWYMHHFIFSLNYDCLTTWKKVKPQFSLFYKLPVTGKGIVNPHTFGGQFALSF